MTPEEERIVEATAADLGISKPEAMRKALRWFHINRDGDVMRRLVDLESRVQEHDRQIRSLRTRVNAKENQVKKLRRLETVESSSRVIRAFREEISVKDREIMEFQGKLNVTLEALECLQPSK